MVSFYKANFISQCLTKFLGKNQIKMANFNCSNLIKITVQKLCDICYNNYMIVIGYISITILDNFIKLSITTPYPGLLPTYHKVVIDKLSIIHLSLNLGRTKSGRNSS